MRTKLAILLATVLSSISVFSQQLIVDVTEQILKVMLGSEDTALT